MTRIRISAELVEAWAADALASRDAVRVIDEAVRRVLYDAERFGPVTRDVEVLGTLLRARGFAGIQLSAFADLMANEARIALKVREVS